MTRLALLASFALLVGCASSEPTRMENFADATFERLDTNRDNVVDAREMDDARARQFARADIDGDGYISGSETADRDGRRGRRGGGDPVARMDRDGDGRVSRTEFRGTTDLLERADYNGDGRVTRREFEEAAERMAARLDRRR